LLVFHHQIFVNQIHGKTIDLLNILLQINLVSFASQNGGVCFLRQGTFGCSCPIGFSGVCCEINLVATNPCYTNPCVNGGTCQVAGQNLFRCVCPVGFNGIQCELRVCDPNPCLYGGIKSNKYDRFLLKFLMRKKNFLVAYVCSCTPSFYGPCCEIRNYCIPNPW
jgi:hypothetical protein